MQKPLLNLGDIQNGKMVCLISGPRGVYIQNLEFTYKTIIYTLKHTFKWYREEGMKEQKEIHD